MTVMGWAIKAFVLSHLMPILGVVGAVLVVFVFGPASVLAFLRTRAGNVVVALVVAGVVGWYARATVDDTVALSRQLAAQQAAANAAITEERAKAAAAAALAAEARRQAEDQRAVATAAADRTRSLEAERDALAEQVADVADAPAPRAACKLTAAGAAAFAGIGARHHPARHSAAHNPR